MTAESLVVGLLALGGALAGFWFLYSRAVVRAQRAEGKVRMAELDKSHAETRLASSGKEVGELLEDLSKVIPLKPPRFPSKPPRS